MKNILETIKTDDVIAVRFDYSAITGKPMLCVDTYDEDDILYYLDDSFKIHQCNEFLRSLKLTEDVKFVTYRLYAIQISLINKLLPIKRMMEAVTDKKYSEIGLTAYQVYSYILDVLLSKHKMATKGLDIALQEIPPEAWVSEALADLL